MIKICTKCKTEKEITEFVRRGKQSKSGYGSWCKSCVREEYHTRQREGFLGKARERHKKLRLDAFAHYGTKCTCCGETAYEFLTIDHINNDGSAHRKAIGHGGAAIYRWLKANNYPSGFRVLCHNCNSSYGFYGYCPHEEGRSTRH